MVDDGRQYVPVFDFGNAQKAFLENGEFLLESDHVVRGDAEFFTRQIDAVEFGKPGEIVSLFIVGNLSEKGIYERREFRIESLQIIARLEALEIHRVILDVSER